MTKNHILLFYFCISFVFIKIISISLTNFNLYGDEAQYWLWSKELAFGYYSKPPLLAWLIYLVTTFFGDGFVTLKVIPITLYCINSSLVYILTIKIFKDKNLAFCSALTFFLLPAVSLSSFLLSTDIILITFWTASLIQVLKIKENQSYFNFAMLGFFLGLSFLAKYAAIYFLISLFLLCILEKEFRVIFLRFKLILSVLILILLLVPNIMWNYQNDWTTISHTANNISFHRIKLNLFNSSEFILSQIIMIGPILFFGFLLNLFKKIKISFNEKFLISFAVPALLIVLVESLLVRAHANWAAVSLVSLSVFFVGVLYKTNKKIILINNYVNLIIGCVLFVMIGINYSLNSFNRISGLKDFVEYLDEKNINELNNMVITDRLLYSNLSYEYYQKKIKLYSPFIPDNKITNHFQLKNPLPVNFSKNFILIGHENDIAYLKEKNKIKLLGSKSFPFSKENIEIYEVFFN